MDLLLKFFKQEIPEYNFPSIKIVKAIPIEIDSSRLKPYLLEKLSQSFLDSNFSKLDFLDFSNQDSISNKIIELEHFHSLCEKSFYYEIDSNSETFNSALDSVQFFSSILDNSLELSSGLINDNSELKRALAVNYLKIKVLDTRYKNLKSTTKEFELFEVYSKKFIVMFDDCMKNKKFYESIEILNEFAELDEKHEIFKFKVFQDFRDNIQKNNQKVYDIINQELSKICWKFEPCLFENLLLTLVTVFDSDKALGVIKSLFDESIEECINNSFKKAVPYLPLSPPDYMIKITPVNHFVPLVSEVFKNLTLLMFNYEEILSWLNSKLSIPPSSDLSTQSMLEKHEKILKSLKRHKKRFWNKISKSISHLLENSNQINQLQQGELHQFTGLFSSFIIFCSNFSGSNPDSLQEIVLSKIEKYLQFFHNNSLLKVLNLLEAETWERLPIPKSFDLQTELCKSFLIQSPFVSKSFDSDFSFSSFMSSDPFSLSLRKSIGNSANIQSRVSLNLNAPIMSMSGMNILKLLHTYVELTSVLSSLSFHVFHYLTQIIDFYVISSQVFEIFHFFSSPESSQQLFQEIPPLETAKLNPGQFYSLHLFQSRYKSILNRVTRVKDIIDTLPGELGSQIKSFHSQSRPAYSLTKAIIALESYKNLVSALEPLKNLELLLNPEEFCIVEGFLAEHQDLCSVFPYFILEPLVRRNLELSWVKPFICSSKWEENTSGNRGFVVKLLKYLEEFAVIVNDNKIVPSALKGQVWSIVVDLSIDEIVDGFSMVSLCGVEGRKQMKRDLKYFCRKVKKFAYKKPKQELEFIEIWNCDLDEVIDWILENFEISLDRQLRLLRQVPSFVGLGEGRKKKIEDKIKLAYLAQIYM